MTNQLKIKEPFIIDFKNFSDDDIISLRTEIEKEFKKRKIKFSAGEIGETVAIHFFNNTPGLDNLQKAPTGTKTVDALSRKGERYSIKTIKDGSKSGTIYPDAENKEKQLFEYILLVILNEDFKLKSLYRFSWNQFLEVKQWDKTMNAWYIPKTQKAKKIGETLYE
ncbi:MAG TPA: hypothetical protein VK498_04545 [Ferruginibacter sp.]|nr:hypothetical protein [Ferruginibacter sp.]